jgi:putative ABC transport system permease protein
MRLTIPLNKALLTGESAISNSPSRNWEKSSFILPSLLYSSLAWPLGWYALHKWLENFAYRVDLSLFLSIFAGVLSFITTALPIGFHSIKAATTNPVDTLRYE